MAIEKLAPAEVKHAKPGMHGDGGGLWLRVKQDGKKSWVLRFMINGRSREMGLGSFDDESLAKARVSAAKWRALAKQGIDPIAERNREDTERAVAEAAKNGIPTFEECATRFIESRKPEWSNPKHAKQWTATLKKYAFSAIGKMPVDQIENTHILKILEPIWITKTETATRVRARIENVLDWATVLKYRTGENPAMWRGNLVHLLSKPSKVTAVEHHRALSWNKVGQFMKDLRKRDGMGARALEFLVLTATRSGEVRGAQWSEIDLNTNVWTIPKERTKTRKNEHRVPLSDQAVALLRSLPIIDAAEWVFPAVRGGRLSDMTISAVCRRMGVDAVPHGFRSTFRDWAAEKTAYPNHVCEMALGHAIGDKVEAAYRRGDLFDKRRKLMTEWSDYCDIVEQEKSATVTPIRKAK